MNARTNNLRNQRTPALFAIVLTGDALAPLYKNNDTLIIDPGRKAGPGDAVLVFFDGNKDRRGVMLLNRDGDLADLHGGHVMAGCFTVEGVVIAAHAAGTMPRNALLQASGNHVNDAAGGQPMPENARTDTKRRPRRMGRAGRMVRGNGRARRQGGEPRQQFLGALCSALLWRSGMVDATSFPCAEAVVVLAAATQRDLMVAQRMIAECPLLAGKGKGNLR